MSSANIRPSSLEGIKRLTKSLKIEHGITHQKALDCAAQAAGFQNFRHARNVLNNAPKQQKYSHGGNQTFITAYWKDRSEGGSGRETLTVWLSTPWSNLITLAQLKIQRVLGGFKSQGPDHLAAETLLVSQSAARRLVCEAARSLQFMDATKLRPSKGYRRAYPNGDLSNPIPGRDHPSIWFEPETKRYLFADEPYEGEAKRKAQERETWAKQHGYVIHKPEWAGMYAPDIGSRLYLVAHEEKGISLQPIVAALNKLPSPIVEVEWNGESAPMTLSFESPDIATRTVSGKVNPTLSRYSSGQNNSVAYVQAFVGPRRRPKGRMSIEGHTKVGQLLQSVRIATFNRKGVYNRLDAIRSELDDWAECEYNYDELPNEQFFSLYYRDGDSTFAKSLSTEEREQYVENLEQAKNELSNQYPDCPPLRSIIRKIDVAIKSLASWF